MGGRHGGYLKHPRCQPRRLVNTRTYILIHRLTLRSDAASAPDRSTAGPFQRATAAAYARQPTTIIYARGVRMVSLVLLLSGCELAFPLDGPDAAASANCSALFGGAATPIIDFDGSPEELDPSFTSNVDELFLTIAVGGLKHIHRSERTGQGRYTRAVVVPLLNTQFEDFDPALSQDGLSMLFLSSGTALVSEVRRDSADAAFGVPGIVNLPESVRGLDVTPDGLTVYFQDSDDNLAFARRPSPTASFGGVVDLGFTGSFPTISADQRELYYRTEDQGIVRRRREDPDAGTFGPEEMVVDGGDPEISLDGRTLIFVRDQTLLTMTRECP
ncbi:MAG: hypothetical protein ABI867_06320 [Kofleriaceae bacterium]